MGDDRSGKIDLREIGRIAEQVRPCEDYRVIQAMLFSASRNPIEELRKAGLKTPLDDDYVGNPDREDDD